MNGRSLNDAWVRTVRRRATATALIVATNGERTTFAELDASAAGLRERHDALREIAGRAVAFGVPNGRLWFELFLAVARGGGVVVPLDATEPAAAQRRIAETIGAALWWDGSQWIALPKPRRYSGDAALIKLTSGTTGEPRAIVFTAAQMLADGRQVAASMGISSRDLNYALIPLGHSYGLGNLTIPLLSHGVPLVLGSSALPHAVADDFARHRPTVFPSVPAVWRALCAAELAPGALASLRLAISAGAPLPPDVARQFEQRFGRRLHNFYGSSETGGIAYDRSGAATLQGGVGRPLRGVKVTASSGGRICVCSPAVFTRQNRRRSGPLGCCVPPDRVQRSAAGDLTLLGRSGSVVKIGGRRVDLGEVAARLRRIDGVRDAWVAVSGDVDPVIGAVVLTERTAADLRSRLLADSAAWKVPKRWSVLREFPLTTRGKPDAAALRRALFG